MKNNEIGSAFPDPCFMLCKAGVYNLFLNTPYPTPLPMFLDLGKIGLKKLFLLSPAAPVVPFQSLSPLQSLSL